MPATTPFDKSRVWLPAGLFSLAVGLHVQAPTLVAWLELGPGRARLVEQATATALWLAATYAGVTLLTALLNAAAARRTGHRLPRLVTDLLAVVVWIVAGIGIASQVFEQPAVRLDAVPSHAGAGAESGGSAAAARQPGSRSTVVARGHQNCGERNGAGLAAECRPRQVRPPVARS